ncbi:MAG: hypothetical protein MUP47_06710, partial [Phycisphaerae bacterium]|nr:hypothetical protein [Phycisphaerae bacterium]
MDAAPRARHQPRPERTGQLLLGAVIVAATVLVYLPSLRNGFIWDDNRYVTENPTLQSCAGLLYLLAVGAYLRFDPLTAPSNIEGRFDPLEGGRRRWGFYALAAGLF